MTQRVIKFRYLWKHDGTGKIVSKEYELSDIQNWLVEYPDHTIRWDIIARLQFTGLTDKHGKEIYEGDIIKCDIIERENHDDYSSGKPIKVYWDEECAGFYPFIKASQWRSEVYDIEKLGDIYTTPELVDPKMIER